MSRPSRRQDFDAPAFYAALNKIRNLRDFTWKEVSAASGVSTTTLSRMADGRHPDAASLASLSHWAGMNPANFMADPDKPPYDKSLSAIAMRLRNSIAWLRDGTPTTGGGIGLGDMIDLLPVVEAALATQPLAAPVQQEAGALRKKLVALGYSDTAIKAMGDDVSMLQRSIDARAPYATSPAHPVLAPVVREPLTEDAINELWMDGEWYRPGLIANGQAEAFARAIEAAHGIQATTGEAK